jgi:ADP-ribosylglycohydrolase
MRVAPLGIVAAGDAAMAKRLAEADGAVSHSGEGIYAGVAVAVAVAVAMTGAEVEEVYDAALAAIPEDSWTSRNLVLARELVQSIDDPAELAVALYDRLAITPYFWADMAPEAVAFAFAGVLHGRGVFTKSMLFAVNLGRDSDTNAAIAGCISGAMSGISSFPADWVTGLRPVAGDCLRTMAGIHPLDIADQLASTLEESHA